MDTREQLKAKIEEVRELLATIKKEALQQAEALEEVINISLEDVPEDEDDAERLFDERGKSVEQHTNALFKNHKAIKDVAKNFCLEVLDTAMEFDKRLFDMRQRAENKRKEIMKMLRPSFFSRIFGR